MPHLRISELDPNDATRVGDIDRTETIRKGYRVEDGRLTTMDVEWEAPPWFADADESHGHSVANKVSFVQSIVEKGGLLWGAFDGDRLVGIAALQPRLTDTMAQLAFLHVSNGYRRQGIASRLFDKMETLARESGARSFYVSATPTGSAVGFYTSRGFEMTQSPHPELFELEPEDIHMTKPL